MSKKKGVMQYVKRLKNEGDLSLKKTCLDIVLKQPLAVTASWDHYHYS